MRKNKQRFGRKITSTTECSCSFQGLKIIPCNANNAASVTLWRQQLRQTQIMFNFSDKSKLDITVIPLIINFRKQTCIFKLSHHASPFFNFFLLQENDLSRLFYTANNSKIIFKRHGIIAKYILKTAKAIKSMQNWTVKFKKVWKIYIIWNLVPPWSYPYKGAVAFDPSKKSYNSFLNCSLCHCMIIATETIKRKKPHATLRNEALGPVPQSLIKLTVD